MENYCVRLTKDEWDNILYPDDKDSKKAIKNEQDNYINIFEGM